MTQIAESGSSKTVSETQPASAASTLKDVVRVAELSRVHSVFEWFAAHSGELTDWQIEVTEIPAPPFGESKRAEWLRRRFAELGLKEVHIDQAGNVLGVFPGQNPQSKFIALCAHLDTVFPPDTNVKVRREETRLYAPGISDNSAGLTALLAIAASLKATGVRTAAPILFVANVGEEGEGDLRGMRHIFEDKKWGDAIAQTIVVDGGGTESIISEGLGSRRFLVTVRGPGGHSWSDFGTPNPVVALARAIDIVSRTPVSTNPKTILNIGVISGGTSVNSIPESASMKVDIRSASPAEIDRMERALRLSVKEALAQGTTEETKSDKQRGRLTAEIQPIGNRPAAELNPNARIVQVVRAVDTQLGITSRQQRASTDANIPISLGREALTIGAGGTGSGAHTLHEWYDPANRELGLKRILLSVLTLAGAKE